jgi:hypothetical protein
VRDLLPSKKRHRIGANALAKAEAIASLRSINFAAPLSKRADER